MRRKEFERTAKREYTKALTTLMSYALVPASVSKEDGREGVRLKVEAISAGKNGYAELSMIAYQLMIENAIL